MNVNKELELMGYQHQTEKFIKTLDHLSKTPHWIERLEQLLDCGVELGQINSIFEFLDKNLSTVNENCWKLITELSNAVDFIDFLKNIADHDITNLINGVDDHSDEKLIQEDTVTSLIQVKQFLMPLMEKKTDTVADVLNVLLNLIKTNPTLGDKISLCSNSNMALQNMYNSISNRALLIATTKTTFRINYGGVINDKDEEMSNIIDDFIVQVDTAQEIFNVGSVLIQMGHFGYRIYEQKLHGTESMINYLKSLKNELDEWKEIVDKAQEMCYYLTFFPSRNILAFYDYFTSENLYMEIEEECKILIRFVNSKAQLPPREGVQKIPHESNDYLSLGQHVKSDIVTKGKSFVAACNNISLVSNIIMSLFANHGSYPEPWQLLICTSSTTIEELSIFIKRSFFASNNRYENHLFCIANLELLDFELQYSLRGRNAPSYLRSNVHETMKEIYYNLCKNVIAVSSDLSGQGNTEWIKESSYNKKKIPRSFLISDAINLRHSFYKCRYSLSSILKNAIHIFIEIASTTEQRLRSSLPMLGFLLSEHLSWNIGNLKIS
ncbi:8941_t:CDS:2 [Funneliformis geosporum]|uniref:8941_t:CDS:1 n=1 Tax=Funneliformis geosporum TaxID=1117311 RepID=A0A9W4SM78_9GLOM|nr:8941_t:CDS:2 [Funneliformis geosporum]